MQLYYGCVIGLSDCFIEDKLRQILPVHFGIYWFCYLLRNSPINKAGGGIGKPTGVSLSPKRIKSTKVIFVIVWTIYFEGLQKSVHRPFPILFSFDWKISSSASFTPNNRVNVSSKVAYTSLYGLPKHPGQPCARLGTNRDYGGP